MYIEEEKSTYKQEEKKIKVSIGVCSGGGIGRVVVWGGALVAATLIAAFTIKRSRERPNVKDQTISTMVRQKFKNEKEDEGSEGLRFLLQNSSLFDNQNSSPSLHFNLCRSERKRTLNKIYSYEEDDDNDDDDDVDKGEDSSEETGDSSMESDAETIWPTESTEELSPGFKEIEINFWNSAEKIDEDMMVGKEGDSYDDIAKNDDIYIRCNNDDKFRAQSIMNMNKTRIVELARVSDQEANLAKLRKFVQSVLLLVMLILLLKSYPW